MADERWIIVGLGNPGPEYAGNRHNAGAMVLALLAERMGARFKSHRTRNDIAEGRLSGQPVTLARPHSYMNLSGGPVTALVGFYKLSPERGWLSTTSSTSPSARYAQARRRRQRAQRPALDHRVARHPRLLPRPRRHRPPPGRMDPAAFVLKDFSSAERKELPFALDRAADATEALITKGLIEAQNQFHTDPPALS